MKVQDMNSYLNLSAIYKITRQFDEGLKYAEKAVDSIGSSTRSSDVVLAHCEASD